MPPFVPQVQTDQFAQTPARGDLDLAITRSGVLTGVLNGVANLKAGDRVKLDSTVTTPGVVGLVAAADNEAAFGVIKRNAKQATFAPGDHLEVTFSGGQAIYEVGATTLTPGTLVGMNAGFLVAADGTHLQMGILLDYVTQSAMARVITGWLAS